MRYHKSKGVVNPNDPGAAVLQPTEAGRAGPQRRRSKINF